MRGLSKDRLFVVIPFLLTLALQYVSLAVWESSVRPTAQAHLEDKDPRLEKLPDVAQKFTETYASLALASIGGIAATFISIKEKFRLTSFRRAFLAIALAFFSGSLFFAYLSSGTLLQELSEVGQVTVGSGDFHIVSSLQFITMLLGALSFSAIMLDLISDTTRSPENDLTT